MLLIHYKKQEIFRDSCEGGQMNRNAKLVMEQGTPQRNHKDTLIPDDI